MIDVTTWTGDYECWGEDQWKRIHISPDSEDEAQEIQIDVPTGYKIDIRQALNPVNGLVVKITKAGD